MLNVDHLHKPTTDLRKLLKFITSKVWNLQCNLHCSPKLQSIFLMHSWQYQDSDRVQFSVQFYEFSSPISLLNHLPQQKEVHCQNLKNKSHITDPKTNNIVSYFLQTQWI